MSKGLGQKIAIKFTEKLLDPGYISSDINVALNKPVTSDKTLTPQNASSGITNGDIATANYVSGGSGLTYVQIDLEEIVMLDRITVWHYYSDSRTYYDTKVEISVDGETWVTVFDSAISGTYTETSAGKTHSFTPVEARYIRDWLNGSNKNTGNHWVEIKAFKMVKAFDKNGFAVTGQQRNHIGGILVDGNYIIDKVERYPIEIAWQADFSLGTLTDVINSGVLKLAGSIEESFEGESYHPEITVTGTWKRTNRTAIDGSYALESNNKSNSSDTSAYLTFQAEADEQFSICYRVSSESNYDKFYLYHNGAAKVSGISGNGNWLTYTGTTLAGENIIRARYTKDGSTSSNLDAGFIDKFILYRNYKESGTYLSEAIPLSGENRIRWDETIPEGTSIFVEVATGETQGAWTAVENGDVITADTNLWVRATLETSDVAVTPILGNLRIEAEVNPPLDDILITMHPLGRFNNVEGNLKVSYDASKGNLAGRGGAVESFEVEFLPEDLIPLPNPIVDQGKFTVNAGTTLSFTQVNYFKAFGKETFTVIPSCTVAFILAETINP